MTSRRWTRTMRVFFDAHGTGPWPCGYKKCDDLVYELGSATGHVHHIDHNETNDVPENLTAVHQPCHIRLQIDMARGKYDGYRYSEEQRAAISERMRARRAREAAAGAPSPHQGHSHSEETRELIREQRIGSTHTEATKEKMRRSATGRQHSEETKRKISEARKRRKTL
jgi:hypothetical protein